MYLFLCATKLETTVELRSEIEKTAESIKRIPTDKKLGNRLLRTINQSLQENQSGWSDLKGVAVFAGPGPFTALRIVHAIANTVGYSLNCPVANSDKESWQADCIDQIKTNRTKIIVPVYGRPPNITKQKK